MTKKIGLLLPVCSMLLLGAGCFQGVVENRINANLEDGESVDLQNGQVNFRDDTTGASVVIGQDITLSSDFPDDVKVYPGAKIIASSFAQNSSEGALLIITTSDKASLVASWYDDQLVKAGWTKTTTMSANGQESRVYTNNGKTMSVTAGSDESTTTAQITWVPEQD